MSFKHLKQIFQIRHRLVPVYKTNTLNKQDFQTEFPANVQTSSINVQQYFSAIKGQLEQPIHLQNSVNYPEYNEQLQNAQNHNYAQKYQSSRSTQVTTN